MDTLKMDQIKNYGHIELNAPPTDGPQGPVQDIFCGGWETVKGLLLYVRDMIKPWYIRMIVTAAISIVDTIHTQVCDTPPTP